MLIDTTHYTRLVGLSASLDSVVADTVFHARMNRRIVDSTLYTRLQHVLADTAWLTHPPRLVPDSASYHRLRHTLTQVDSLLACLQQERSERRRR